MKQYLDLCNRIINEGEWIENTRTGKRCLTIIGVNLKYDMRDNRLPILTTRKVNWKPAIAEFLGYLKGYRYSSDFRKLGCKTWDANANENKAWLANEYRLGPDDMGRVYGVQARYWLNKDREEFDQVRKVYNDLKQGIDNRAEIITFWNPGELHMGCLNSCMHTHTFSLVNGILHLTSEQRSDDVPLGHVFNQIQCGMFLMLMAQITGNLPGIVHHNIVNAHIYEDQLMTMVNQHLPRKPRDLPTLIIDPGIKTLDDVIDLATPEHFILRHYDPLPAIKYEFSV